MTQRDLMARHTRDNPSPVTMAQIQDDHRRANIEYVREQIAYLFRGMRTDDALDLLWEAIDRVDPDPELSILEAPDHLPAEIPF